MATSASGVRAGKAYVEIGAKLGPLQQGLRDAQARLQAFGSAVRGIGLGLSGIATAALAPLAAAVGVFASTGDNLDEAASRTGMTTEALSELGFVASLSGASMEDLEAGVRIMQRTLAKAAEGSDAASEALAMVGLSAASIGDLAPDQQLAAIADGLASIDDAATRTAAAMAILGRGGTKLLPLLEGGSAGLAQGRQRARQIGASISTEDAKAAARLSDALDTIRASAKGATVAIGAALAPAATQLAEAIATAVGGLSAFIRQNQGAIVAAAAAATSVLAAGLAITGLGLAITGASIVLGAFASAISAAVAVLGVLLTPIGIAVAGVAALGVGFAMLAESGGASLSRLRTTAEDAFAGISDALRGGDIQTAAEVLWAGLKLAFAEGLGELQRLWTGWSSTVIEVMAIVAHTIAGAWDEVTTAVVRAVSAATSAGSAFSSMVSGAFGGDPIQAAVGMANAYKGGIGADATLTDEQARRSADREKALAERLAEIDRDRSIALDEIERSMGDPREALRRALEEARQSRLDAEFAAYGPPVPPNLGDDLSREVERQRSAARGTFSAAATQALEGGVVSLYERTAKATEETAKHTKRLADEASAGGLVFGE